MKFEKKVVVITGGNSGIGRAIAQEFVKEGAQVVILGRNLETLNETASQLGSFCRAIQIDVTKVSEIEKTFEKIASYHPKIDVLVLGAGILKADGPTQNVQEKDFDQVVATNFKGPYFTFQKAIPYLNDRASIISISSMAAQMGIEGLGIYGATKAALDRLTIAFSAEFLLAKGWRFNMISPGYTKTHLLDPKLREDPNFFKRTEKVIPQRRIAEPIEVARCALFLASSEASYICNANILIDGGMSTIYPLNELKAYAASKPGR